MIIVLLVCSTSKLTLTTVLQRFAESHCYFCKEIGVYGTRAFVPESKTLKLA